MNDVIEHYINVVTNFYFGFYVFAATALLIGTLFLKDKFKTESYNLLYIFNTGAAWGSFFILIYSAIDLFIAWYGQNPYEWYYFKDDAGVYSIKWFYFRLYFPLLIGMFLFFRRLRIHRLFTIIFLLVSNIGLIEKIMYTFKDYRPTSWSTYYYEPISEKIIKYSVVFLFLVMIYIIAKKRNKLPHPSVFLK